MKDKKLLVCIAFHYAEERVKYLDKIVNLFLNDYKCNVHIIIDTNKNGFLPAFMVVGRVFIHNNLEHPFHLTWQHRKHIKDNIYNYDYFMYIEDDMLLPWENFLSYIENFKLLWPNAVPGFVRIEQKQGQKFISDIPRQQTRDFKVIGGKMFHAFPFPFNYHAFWIIPQKELKETMKDDFVRLSDGREFAASYTAWELGKPCMVEVENGLVSEKCYSYHLPNNYALSPNSPNGKIKPQNIFI